MHIPYARLLLINIVFQAITIWAPSYSLDTSTLSLEEKIGQLLMVHFTGSHCNESAIKLIEKAHVGSFILYPWSNELSSHKQVIALTEGMQQTNSIASKIPLFIAIDQEGGNVSRLSKVYRNFPSNREVATLRMPYLASRIAYAQGRQLQALGINVNLAPVVDIWNGTSTSFLKERAFSSITNEVTLFSQAALEGYGKANVMATLKHFPGHGSCDGDSHAITPTSHKTEKELFEHDCLPFNFLSSSAPAIMTAHIYYPNIDPKNISSLSYYFLSTILREKIHFQGLIISDSLVMQGANKDHSSVCELAYKALVAGSDIICLGGKLIDQGSDLELKESDILSIHAYLVQSVKNGKLSEQSVNKKIERILNAKNRYAKASRPLSDAEIIDFELIHKELSLLFLLQTLPEETLRSIALGIFTNETSGNLEKLIHWNTNENFASLGIGHFIWYPKDQEKQFTEGFLDFLDFCHKESISTPPFLKSLQPCPWQTKEELHAAKDSAMYKEMHTWLVSSIEFQARYILKSKIVDISAIINSSANNKERALILDTLQELCSTSKGLFAVIDYLNFKGNGLNPKERYQNRGWGLYQVLQEMQHLNDKNTIIRFQQACINVLTLRTKLSPQPHKENQWLAGWINRIQKYNTDS